MQHITCDFCGAVDDDGGRVELRTGGQLLRREGSKHGSEAGIEVFGCGTVCTYDACIRCLVQINESAFGPFEQRPLKFSRVPIK